MGVDTRRQHLHRLAVLHGEVPPRRRDDFSVVAGSGAPGDKGDNTPATANQTVRISEVGGIAVRSGSVYFSDTTNGKIRRVQGIR